MWKVSAFRFPGSKEINSAACIGLEKDSLCVIQSDLVFSMTNKAPDTLRQCSMILRNAAQVLKKEERKKEKAYTL